MKFTERSYSSHLLRPKPLIHSDSGGGFLLMMTPWGAQEECQKVMDFVVQHLTTIRQDQEHTSAFQKILSLSDNANQLRQSALMANDFLFRNINSETHEIVIEFLFLAFQRNHVSWCQLGCPHLLLKKANQATQPISCFPESSRFLQNFPLPSYYLGAEPTVAPRCGDLHLDKNDELILLSSNQLPKSIWTLESKKDLEIWTDELTQENNSQPFWLGRLKLD